MTETIGITDIAFALPKTVRSNREIAEHHGFEERFISEKLGIAERRIAAPDENVSDLAAAAAAQVLEQTGTHSDKIDLVVVVTQTPDFCLPHVSALVHAALDLPKRTAAFDIGLGCSGYVYGLSCARALMLAEGMQRGLLITAETYSRIMDEGDRATAPLFGDGASATLLTSLPRYAIGATTFGTDGSQHGALIARGTGSRVEKRSPLFMDGRAIFGFMMKEAPDDVLRCLDKNGIVLDAIDRFVFHQASRYMLQTLTRQMKLAPDKVVIDLADVGNTTSSTIPIALKRQVLGVSPPAKTILLSGFGVGLSWASTILTLQN